MSAASVRRPVLRATRLSVAYLARPRRRSSFQNDSTWMQLSTAIPSTTAPTITVTEFSGIAPVPPIAQHDDDRSPGQPSYAPLIVEVPKYLSVATLPLYSESENANQGLIYSDE